MRLGIEKLSSYRTSSSIAIRMAVRKQCQIGAISQKQDGEEDAMDLEALMTTENGSREEEGMS